MISSSKSLFKSFSRYHYQRNIFNKNIPFAKYAESNNYLKKEGGIEEVFIITKNQDDCHMKVQEVFKQNNIDLTYIEPKFLNKEDNSEQKVMFSCTFNGNRSDQTVQKALKDLVSRFETVKFSDNEQIIPWFPKDLNDLLLLKGDDLMVVIEDVNNDHPTFIDKEYRKRINEIGEISKSHILGQPIPLLTYTKQENECWKHIYARLDELHKDVSSEHYLYQKRKLEKEINFDQQIPQLRDLDQYISEKTNFRIKAAAGIISQREFLNALAHRVFFCTQYLRHHSSLEYTPEPDLIHDILGHIPMFADPIIADLSQQIGLLSLGATDQQIKQLGNLYFFTLEFGAFLEKGKLKTFGAGILGSVSECQHFLSNKAKFEIFEPAEAWLKSFPIQDVQSLYLYNNSFEECLEKLRKFIDTIEKPLKVWYDFSTKTVQWDRKVVIQQRDLNAPKFNRDRV